MQQPDRAAINRSDVGHKICLACKRLPHTVNAHIQPATGAAKGMRAHVDILKATALARYQRPPARATEPIHHLTLWGAADPHMGPHNWKHCMVALPHGRFILVIVHQILHLVGFQCGIAGTNKTNGDCSSRTQGFCTLLKHLSVTHQTSLGHVQLHSPSPIH